MAAISVAAPVLFMAATAWSLPDAYAAVATTTTATVATSSLQEQIDANNQQITDLNQKIAMYQAELKQAGADKKTLQLAINALNLQRNKVKAQISAAQYQINVTQLQIQQLGYQMADTEQTIATDKLALVEYLKALQKADNQSLLMQMLSSGSLVQAWSDINSTLQMQAAVQNEMQTLREQEDNLANSKVSSQQKQETLASQKKSLASQQQSLTATEQSKSQLLAATNAKESNYQKLLAEAEAELKSFTTFTDNAGGSTNFLINQTACDSWGCYYNQRDAAWGRNSLDGTQYTLASDGCLVTSMAMIMTHYGYRDVTPATINEDPGNFAIYYPAYLLFTIHVDGVTATRKATTLNAALAGGNPVVAGLNVYGGTHFIVIVGRKNGDYIMRDPYFPNAKDVGFSTRYSLKNIFSIARVVISG